MIVRHEVVFCGRRDVNQERNPIKTITRIMRQGDRPSLMGVPALDPLPCLGGSEIEAHVVQNPFDVALVYPKAKTQLTSTRVP